MIEFAESENREMLEDHHKELLKRPYKVEVEWPDGGGMWVGVTMSYPNEEPTKGKKFDREDTIGDVRDWITDVRLGKVKP